jgi:hypothetical protein
MNFVFCRKYKGKCRKQSKILDFRVDPILKIVTLHFNRNLFNKFSCESDDYK